MWDEEEQEPIYLSQWLLKTGYNGKRVVCAAAAAVVVAVCVIGAIFQSDK